MIEWVSRHKPVLNSLPRVIVTSGSMKSIKRFVVIHIEAKNAYLIKAARECNAEVHFV